MISVALEGHCSGPSRSCESGSPEKLVKQLMASSLNPRGGWSVSPTVLTLVAWDFMKPDCWSVATFILHWGICMPYFISSSKATLQSRGLASFRRRAGSWGCEEVVNCQRLPRSLGVARAEMLFLIWLQSPFLFYILEVLLPARLSVVICWTLGFACSGEAGITKENSWHLL